jgi:hypothetical protein
MVFIYLAFLYFHNYAAGFQQADTVALNKMAGIGGRLERLFRHVSRNP